MQTVPQDYVVTNFGHHFTNAINAAMQGTKSGVVYKKRYMDIAMEPIKNAVVSARCAVCSCYAFIEGRLRKNCVPFDCAMD